MLTEQPARQHSNKSSGLQKVDRDQLNQNATIVHTRQAPFKNSSLLFPTGVKVLGKEPPKFPPGWTTCKKSSSKGNIGTGGQSRL